MLDGNSVMLLKVNMNDEIVDQKDLLSFFYERRWYNERNNHIQILTKRSIRDKLLEYFNLNKTPGSKILYLPSTITDLANYLAIDRSAMSRELKNLRDDGFIETKGKRIYLKY